MLGRLLDKSTQNPGNLCLNSKNHSVTKDINNTNDLELNFNIQTSMLPSNATVNTFEDSYTRQILYGTQDANLIKPSEISEDLYRMVISQDGGCLRLKQVLLDTGNSEVFAVNSQYSRNPLNSSNQSGSCSIKQSFRSACQTPQHGVSELNEYMYGCGLPSNESFALVKVHILPDFAATMLCAVLVSRLFYIAAEDGTFDETMSAPCAKWQPKPTVQCADFSWYDKSLVKQHSGYSGSIHTKSRFAIGIVIPIQSLSDLENVVFNSWDEISRFLVSLQRLISIKWTSYFSASVLSLSTIHDASSRNRRVQFPAFSLKIDVDINNQLKKFKGLMRHSASIPRLINSNSLIKACAENHNDSLKPMLLNWILEVLNWLEFRDGRSLDGNSMHSGTNKADLKHFRYSFLITLMALVLQFRELIASKPFGDNPGNVRELTRVVIMTTNPAVAKKLVFIVNALLPQQDITFAIQNETVPNMDTFKDKTMNKKEFEDGAKCVLKAVHSDKEFDGTVKAFLPRLAHKRSPAMPIPGNDRSLASPAELCLSFSHSQSVFSAKGWEVPIKSSASIYSKTPENACLVEGIVQSIPIKRSLIPKTPNNEQETNQSFSSSYLYLSSSLSLSFLSASNYSLSKIGGSLLEKWKGSLSNSGVNANGVFASLSTLLGNGVLVAKVGVNTESNQPLPLPSYSALASLTKQPSILSIQTPSPSKYSVPKVQGFDILNNKCGHEHASLVKPMLLASVSNANSGFHGQHRSPFKLSRTQSMFDLFNQGLEKKTLTAQSKNDLTNSKLSLNNNCERRVDQHLKTNRLRTGIFLPMYCQENFGNVADSNLRAVEARCSRIMDFTKFDIKTLFPGTVQVYSQEEMTMGLAFEFSTTDFAFKSPTIYKERALLPRVGFSDEFRPEYSLQSCPFHSKVKGQIMSAMKNDLLFNQNHTRHEAIVSRTILVSLRAREIELIEMLCLSDRLNEEHAGNIASGSVRASNASMRNHPQERSTINNRYKTRVKRIYRQGKSWGNGKLMCHVQNTFDSISELYFNQTQQTSGQCQDFLAKGAFLDSKNDSGPTSLKRVQNFHDSISELVLGLLE